MNSSAFQFSDLVDESRKEEGKTNKKKKPEAPFLWCQKGKVSSLRERERGGVGVDILYAQADGPSQTAPVHIEFHAIRPMSEGGEKREERRKPVSRNYTAATSFCAPLESQSSLSCSRDQTFCLFSQVRRQQQQVRGKSHFSVTSGGFRV